MSTELISKDVVDKHEKNVSMDNGSKLVCSEGEKVNSRNNYSQHFQIELGRDI